jgi:hypothetical protein
MAYKIYDRDRGPVGPCCKRCMLPISETESVRHIAFLNDPDGKLKELSGLYHARCAEPYLSLSRFLNLNPGGPS